MKETIRNRIITEINFSTRAYGYAIVSEYLQVTFKSILGTSVGMPR
jgi:hypothetical protein